MPRSTGSPLVATVADGGEPERSSGNRHRRWRAPVAVAARVGHPVQRRGRCGGGDHQRVECARLFGGRSMTSVAATADQGGNGRRAAGARRAEVIFIGTAQSTHARTAPGRARRAAEIHGDISGRWSAVAHARRVPASAAPAAPVASTRNVSRGRHSSGKAAPAPPARAAGAWPARVFAGVAVHRPVGMGSFCPCRGSDPIRRRRDACARGPVRHRCVAAPICTRGDQAAPSTISSVARTASWSRNAAGGTGGSPR